MRTESKAIYPVAEDVPSTDRDVLVWFEGVSRPGVGHYDPKMNRWIVLTRPKAAVAKKVVAWADYPLADNRPTKGE